MHWKAKKKKRRGNVFQCWLLGPFQCASVEEGCVCEKGTEELVREREREGGRKRERDLSCSVITVKFLESVRNLTL